MIKNLKINEGVNDLRNLGQMFLDLGVVNLVLSKSGVLLGAVSGFMIGNYYVRKNNAKKLEKTLK
ncbi:MAG: hypothetical protein IJ568_00630 [Bacilli bacterium]|nr:hypothetical protein [Bacilli bacterium]